MNGDEQVTLGEVGRAVKRLEDGLTEIRQDIRNLNILDPAVYAVSHQALIDRITSLEEDKVNPMEERLRFIGRTLFTALITLCGSGLVGVLLVTR